MDNRIEYLYLACEKLLEVSKDLAEGVDRLEKEVKHNRECFEYLSKRISYLEHTIKNKK